MLNTAQKVGLARVASRAVRLGRRLVGQGPELVTSRHGVQWRLDLREGIDFSIFLLGSFEPATVRCYERIVKPGDLVLDIGANIGAHTLPLARLVGKSGRVIAFEPTRFAFSKLLENVRLNADLAPRISLLQTMLVAEPTAEVTASIYSSWPLEAMDGVHAEHRGRLMDTTGARAAMLDNVLSELGVARVEFIKLDVDGNEYAVIAGARQTLVRHKPRILMELAPYVYTARPGEFDDLLASLWELGYRLRSVDDDRELPRNVDAIRAMIPRAGGINVLASA